jgi:hypothetical protein
MSATILDTTLGLQFPAGVTIERQFICVEDFELLLWSAR